MLSLAAGAIATGSVSVSAQVLQSAQGAPHALFINILEGEGALNNIRQREAREPIIQVTDENHKPVGSVAIVFLIHDGANGAGATFPGGATSLSATTGADGVAHAPGMSLSNVPGSFTIAVSASLGGLVATATIHQASVISALSTASGGTAAGSRGGSAGGSTGGHVGATIARHGLLHLGKGVLIGTGVAVGAVVVVAIALNTSSSTSLTLGGTRIGP